MKSTICEMCQTSHGSSVCNNGDSTKDKERPTSASSSRFSALVHSKKGTKQKYHEIVAFCNKTGDYFVDDSFPPAPKSLYYNPKAAASNHEDLVSHWIRPKDIVTEHWTECAKWATFRTPLPSDISQGLFFVDLVKKVGLMIYDLNSFSPYIFCRSPWELLALKCAGGNCRTEGVG